MRRIVMFNRVTPEGYFASADGGLDWIVPEDEVDRQAVVAMSEVDTVLLGRRTYEMFASFWPHVVSRPEAEDPHTPGRRSPELHAMAVWLNATTKRVFARSRVDTSWANTQAMGAFDAAAVRALKQQPGKAMIVFGSGTLVSLLTAHGLIDEYQLLVGPLLLGAGRPLFTGLTAQVPLQLAEAKPYASGNVMLRYVRRD